MAKRVKHSTDRSRLVDGCGTILVSDRLTGGYKLVKRKRGAKATTTATKGKVGRPKGSKNKSKATAPVMATKGKVGRPKGSKNKSKATAPVMSSAPAKTSRKNKPKVNAFFQAKANAMKSGAKSFVYGGQKYVATKTKTGMTIFKKAGRGSAMKTASTMTTAPAMTTAPVMATKGKAGSPKGSKNKSSAPQKARRVSKKMA
jgi:hypothetical protein